MALESDTPVWPRKPPIELPPDNGPKPVYSAGGPPETGSAASVLPRRFSQPFTSILLGVIGYALLCIGGLYILALMFAGGTHGPAWAAAGLALGLFGGFGFIVSGVVFIIASQIISFLAETAFSTRETAAYIYETRCVLKELAKTLKK